MSLGEKVQAVATALVTDVHKIEAFIHAELNKLLGHAETDAVAAKDHVETVVAADLTKAAAVVEPPKTA